MDPMLSLLVGFALSNPGWDLIKRVWVEVTAQPIEDVLKQALMRSIEDLALNGSKIVFSEKTLQEVSSEIDKIELNTLINPENKKDFHKRIVDILNKYNIIIFEAKGTTISEEQLDALCARMDETTSPSKFSIELRGGEQEMKVCQHHPNPIQKCNRKPNVAASMRSTNVAWWPKLSNASMVS